MKTIFPHALLVGLALTTVGCNDEYGNITIKDYAIYEFYETDSVALVREPRGTVYLYLHPSTSYSKRHNAQRYFELSRQYGDHIDKQPQGQGCSYFVGIVSAKMLQRTTPEAPPTDVSQHYQLLYCNFYDFVTKAPRIDHPFGERLDSISLANCQGDTCKWLFAEAARGIKYIGGTNAPQPDSTTTLILTLSNGKRLHAPWHASQP